jgi:hypothetical protein
MTLSPCARSVYRPRSCRRQNSREGFDVLGGASVDVTD